MTHEQEFALKYLGSKFALHTLSKYCYYFAENVDAAKNAKTLFDLTFKQKYCLYIVPVGDDIIRISTKNRCGAAYRGDFKVKDIVNMEKTIQNQLTQIKLSKIKLKVKEIEKDFIPYDVPEYEAFYPYITDIVK